MDTLILVFVYKFSEMARISLDTRRLILQKWCKEGLSYGELAKIGKCSKSAVFKIIKKYGEECTVADLPKSRRRSGPADPAIDEKGVKLLTSEQSYSVREIARKLRVSVGTVQNIK